VPEPNGDRQKIRELNALPTKNVLKNKSRVCPPISAVCEIMDNIFDNFEENGAQHDLVISFNIKTKEHGEISVVENSGGVRDKKLEPLVRLGVAYHGAKGSIGIWGEGLKVAAFALGSEVEISTHFPSEKPVVVSFPQGWLESQDWSVPVYAIEQDAPPLGATIFRVRNLHRPIDWAEIMRELAVIYGHKIQAIKDNGQEVHLTFEVDGKQATIIPRPLASPESLRKRLAFPPDFAPRQFTATWRGESGTVKCRLIIGLTPRHSGETSGLYLYGNGRMFARALRTRALGYGESGNAVLRDHPQCWRIHAYAFLEADDGSDIPWQAPLKDGLSENHIITARLREMFREAVAPYSRFAKFAKASELVPFTTEWEGLRADQKAEVLFGRSSHAADLFEDLPEAIKNFEPPTKIETVRVDGVAGEEAIKKLDSHAKNLRQIIKRRDSGGPILEVDVLRALSPFSFLEEKKPSRVAKRPSVVVLPTKVRVSVEVEGFVGSVNS
jgi:hypothetical protein